VSVKSIPSSNRAALTRACAGTLLVFVLAWCASASAAESPQAKRPGAIPVILDTDIGDDIDDTWALGLLLKSPELDLKLVVGDQGKVIYRAKLLAKFLETAGRSDVPVGLGLDVNASGSGAQEAWVRDYTLNGYKGRVYPDGVQAMIDLIMASPEPVTLIAIGPLPNVREALRRDPRIAPKARFVGMHGSVRVGYGDAKAISAEYNVQQDAKACRDAFSAPWPVTITPLDTCGRVDLDGKYYQRVAQSQDPIASAIIENYRLWSQAQAKPGQPVSTPTKSSTLFDTVAVFLAFSTQWLKIEELPIRVTDDGMTKIEPGAKTLRVATEWTNLEAYRQFLTDRLTAK
jgi:inosine-uridine nucleoside N-ribohydrolase